VKTGDRVLLTFEGRTVEATVIMVSDNQRSLALEFDALVSGYAGKMPLLSDERGQYRDLLLGRKAQVEVLEPPSESVAMPDQIVVDYADGPRLEDR
jgi:hypothetical protein